MCASCDLGTRNITRTLNAAAAPAIIWPGARRRFGAVASVRNGPGFGHTLQYDAKPGVANRIHGGITLDPEVALTDDAAI
jgi:hypothetical protein